MNGVLVDANVIIDIIAENPHWYDWSADILTKYADNYPLYINNIIYAEVSVGFERIEDLEDTLPEENFKRLTIPWEAAFLAGKAFLIYRKKGGTKSLPLPDFFIGAHALIDNLYLLTRDAKRYKTYYPELKLITPQYN